ncbi:MAG: hypothetical protein JO058_18605 [Alphaproteobacteria bacterium]|nr:hypothetical protein [Alphaproteobacteria bacterium]
MAIRPSDRARLARLAGPRLWDRRHEVQHRVALRERVRFCMLVAMLLEIESIDPEATSVARTLREARAELTAIPDTPELEEADDDYLAREDPSWIDDWQPKPRYRPPPRVEKTARGEIDRLIGRYRTDCKDMDITKHSVFDLFAWCLSKHGASYAEAAPECAKAAKDLLLELDLLPEEMTADDLERSILFLHDQ